MLTPRELDDATLLEQFENCSLHPNFFTHENLLRLSWILINKFGLKRAIVKNRTIKENYYKEVLKSDKYNIPLTIAYTEILHHFMEKSQSNDFYKLLKEFPRLKYNFKLLVRTHYGYDILKEHRNNDVQVKRPILFTF